MGIGTGFRIGAVSLSRWFVLAIVAIVFVVAGCGGSEQESASSDEPANEEMVTTSESMTEESTTTTDTGANCHMTAWKADVAYVGWVIWRDLGFRDESPGANKIPDEIKGDVEAVARALLTHSDAYGDEELGFPSSDLAIPPGVTPLDNDLARFDYAIDSIDREADALNRARLGRRPTA